MTLDEVVAWYQKKIGTYDKQQWEKTVEQRILSGFTNVPLKNTKLRTEFIDVDLVRGSSFPKAKPKQSLLTVLRLASTRFLFLPIYAKWWIEQTSKKIYSFLLFLYGLQIFNWIVYFCNLNKLSSYTITHTGLSDATDTCKTNDEIDNNELIVTLNELLIPLSLSLALSFIHSQIVATAANKIVNDSRNGSIVQPKRKKRERKRRKKCVKNRSSISSLGVAAAELKNVQQNNGVGDIDCDLVSPKVKTISDITVQSGGKSTILKCALDVNEHSLSVGLRKRNVNWESPSKVQYSVESTVTAEESSNENVQSVEPSDSNQLQENELVEDNDNHLGDQNAADDDGFESLNGKSSSGEENLNADNRTEADSANIIKATEDNNNESPQQYCNKAWARNSFDGKTELPESDVDLICDKMLNGDKASNLVKNTSIDSKLRKHMPSSTKYIPKIESSETDEEGDDLDSLSSPTSNNPFNDVPASNAEWIGITTNSEDCSYSSADNSESQIDCSENGGLEYDYFTTTIILNPSCGIGDRISCTLWDGREIKKAEMSVLDISSAIIERVEAIPETCDYVYIGLAFSVVISLVPAFCRLCEAAINSTDSPEINFLDMPALLLEKTSFSYERILRLAFGESSWKKTILFIDFILRFFLTFLFFFLLAVAERTFKQRFLYAKLFSHLTSSRRARKSELPHFRLNKVRNIKTWLSVRSYLKRRGPQRSVDVIVSAAFILTLLLLAFLSVEWLKDSVQLQSQHNLEALIWSCALGCFLLRFMTLGTKINRKYRSISVLITEQINLYLQIEQKPQNKDELMVSNSVLKLAADLLKELESPFKISGLSANPYLYTTIKVVILSALSGVLSEMLGFKLKLHKIKIK